MSNLRSMLLAVVLGLAAAQCGCKTDALFESRQKTDAPLTSLEHPSGVNLPDIKVADAKEVDLAEAVVANRSTYYRSLKALREYYSKHGDFRKQQWAEMEMKDVERIKPFKYIVDAEIPPTSLRPSKSVAEADAMFDKGKQLMKEGGLGIPALYREDKMVEALQVFTDLITRYPSSDKIDDAAFYCGEISKEYLKDQEEIALKWYERAWTWDPQTPHPVRFQAAVVADYRLHDRAKALELYHEVLRCEPDNKSNRAFAVTRISQLTEDLEGDQRSGTARSTPPPQPVPAPPGATAAKTNP